MILWICYYKLLNVSTSATQEEIKQSYYVLAKKYHPDALKEEEKETSKDLFKEITEAYSILGDTEKRSRYDQLIFGDSSRGEFQNQEAYAYWKDKKQQGGTKMKNHFDDQQERIKEKLKNTQDYQEFINRYDHHRDKSEAREHLYRGEGFKDLNQKYGADYDHYESVDKEHSDKYIKYRERYYENYWDTKENHGYYQQPLSTRVWVQFKKVSGFYVDMLVVWGLLASVFVLYNAHTTAKKTNIFKTGSLQHLENDNHYDRKYTLFPNAKQLVQFTLMMISLQSINIQSIKSSLLKRNNRNQNRKIKSLHNDYFTQ